MSPGVCRKKARRGQATDALGLSSLCTHTVSRNDFGEEREGEERRGEERRGEEMRGEVRRGEDNHLMPSRARVAARGNSLGRAREWGRGVSMTWFRC